MTVVAPSLRLPSRADRVRGVEQSQLDVDVFNLLGFWNRRGTASVCPTTSTVTSPAEMSNLAFIARLYHGIEVTTFQAK